LQGLYKLNLAYDEIKDYLPSFLKLHRLMREEKMQEEDIENALKYAKELPSLENRVQQTRKELENIENKRNNSNAESFILEKQLNKLKGDLELYQSSLHNKREEMAYLNNEIAKIQSLIDKIKNNEDYRIIAEVAKEEVDSILENKKVILSLAVISVVGALKMTLTQSCFWAVAKKRLLSHLLMIIIIHCQVIQEFCKWLKRFMTRCPAFVPKIP
jgi:chromosome segregation ATPase